MLYKPSKTAFNVVSTVVQSQYFDKVAVTVSGKHKSAQIDEVFPLVSQQVPQTAHLGVHNTDMSPIYLYNTYRYSPPLY